MVTKQTKTREQHDGNGTYAKGYATLRGIKIRRHKLESLVPEAMT